MSPAPMIYAFLFVAVVAFLVGCAVERWVERAEQRRLSRAAIREPSILEHGPALFVCVEAIELMRVSSRLLTPREPAIVDPGHSHYVKLFSDPAYAPPGALHVGDRLTISGVPGWVVQSVYPESELVNALSTRDDVSGIFTVRASECELVKPLLLEDYLSLISQAFPPSKPDRSA